MSWKEFLRITKGKIAIFIVLLVTSFFLLSSSLGSLALSGSAYESLKRSPFGVVKCPEDRPSCSLVRLTPLNALLLPLAYLSALFTRIPERMFFPGFFVNFLYLYLLACITIALTSRIKKGE